jgi:hypothetical protein
VKSRLTEPLTSAEAWAGHGLPDALGNMPDPALTQVRAEHHDAAHVHVTLASRRPVMVAPSGASR